ncbi:MAG: hypothetical protein WC712_11150 [Candidatus Brocadiia bacterium]
MTARKLLVILTFLCVLLAVLQVFNAFRVEDLTRRLQGIYSRLSALESGKPSPMPTKTTPAPRTSRAPSPLSTRTPAVGEPELPRIPDGPIADVPEAHAIYDKMTTAFATTDSLAYECEYRWVAEKLDMVFHYNVWLKKDNFARIEFQQDGKTDAYLILDGKTMWSYWVGTRPEFSSETHEEYSKTSFHAYKRIPAPPGMHSIWHEMLYAGRMAMSVTELSSFHGYVDSMQSLLDGVCLTGEKTVEGEPCIGIAASFMKGQRIRYYWVSKNSWFPLEQAERLVLASEQRHFEKWKSVRIDIPLDDTLFKWTPPAGWVEWIPPVLGSKLLAPGAKAPDFSLVSLDGEEIALSKYKGRTLWIIFWRYG